MNHISRRVPPRKLVVSPEHSALLEHSLKTRFQYKHVCSSDSCLYVCVALPNRKAYCYSYIFKIPRFVPESETLMYIGYGVDHMDDDDDRDFDTHEFVLTAAGRLEPHL